MKTRYSSEQIVKMLREAEAKREWLTARCSATTCRVDEAG